MSELNGEIPKDGFTALLEQKLEDQNKSETLEEQKVSKAWTWLAKNGVRMYSKETGDCFSALSVLRALQIAAKEIND